MHSAKAPQSSAAAGSNDDVKDGKTKSLVAFSLCCVLSVWFFFGLENVAPPVNPHGLPQGLKTGVQDLPRWTKSFIALKTHNCTVPYTSPATWKLNIQDCPNTAASPLCTTPSYIRQRNRIRCAFFQHCVTPSCYQTHFTGAQTETQACLLVSQRLGTNTTGSRIKNPYSQ